MFFFFCEVTVCSFGCSFTVVHLGFLDVCPQNVQMRRRNCFYPSEQLTPSTHTHVWTELSRSLCAFLFVCLFACLFCLEQSGNTCQRQSGLAETDFGSASNLLCSLFWSINAHLDRKRPFDWHVQQPQFVSVCTGCLGVDKSEIN